MPKTHANYDKDFRQEAVYLLLGSGHPLKRLAAEQRVSANFVANLAGQGAGRLVQRLPRRWAPASRPTSEGRKRHAERLLTES
jgi:transposase-like protein